VKTLPERERFVSCQVSRRRDGHLSSEADFSLEDFVFQVKKGNVWENQGQTHHLGDETCLLVHVRKSSGAPPCDAASLASRSRVNSLRISGRDTFAVTASDRLNAITLPRRRWMGQDKAVENATEVLVGHWSHDQERQSGRLRFLSTVFRIDRGSLQENFASGPRELLPNRIFAQGPARNFVFMLESRLHAPSTTREVVA
jgi:hypothetical protein